MALLYCKGTPSLRIEYCWSGWGKGNHALIQLTKYDSTTTAVFIALEEMPKRIGWCD